jgi:hypothetical protein
MSRLDVYPKKGEKFAVECDYYKRTKEALTLHYREIADSEGALYFKNIAAIIPADNQKSENQPTRFRVYLKGPAEVEIYAYTFEVNESDISFKQKRVEVTTQGSSVFGDQIDGIYIARSEVVGIIPLK